MTCDHCQRDRHVLWTNLLPLTVQPRPTRPVREIPLREVAAQFMICQACADQRVLDIRAFWKGARPTRLVTLEGNR